MVKSAQDRGGHDPSSDWPAGWGKVSSAIRGLKPQTAVGTSMVVGDVLGQNALGVALVVENDVVGTASSDGPDDAFGKRICLRGAGWSDKNPSAEPADAPAERTAVDRVAVVDHEPGDLADIGGGFDEALGGPGGSGVMGDSDVDQPTAMEREHHEDVEHAESGRDDGEKVTSPRLVQVIPNECRPPLATVTGQPGWPVLGHGPGRDDVPELGQLASNHVLAPSCVLSPHAANEAAQVHVDGWSAPEPTRPPPPEQTPADAMPAEDGLGPHDQNGTEETAEPAGEGGQEPAVERLQAGTLHLAAQDDELVAKEQVFGD